MIVMPFARLGRGPTLFLAFIVLNGFSCAALIGSIMVLHARALGIDTAWVGVLNSLVPFAMMISIVMTGTAQRLGSKRLLISGWTARTILLSPIMFTPLAYRWWGTQGAAVVLFVSVAMFCLVRAVAGIGWNSWLHEIVDEQHRGLYFTAESIMARGVGIVFNALVFGFLLGNPPLWKFSVVSACGVLTGLVSVVFLKKVPGGAPVACEPGITRSPRQEFRRVLADGYFRPFLLVNVAGTFACTAVPLVLILYMREHLTLSPGMIMLIFAVASTASICTIHRWMRIADKHGSPVTMAAAGFMTTACLCLLGLVGHGRGSTWAIGILAVLLVVAESGFFVMCARGYLQRIVPSMRHSYVAVWSTLNALSAGVSSIMAGLMVRSGSHMAFTLTALGIAALMAGVCCVLLRLPERGIDFTAPDCELYNPDQPVWSMFRMYGYVLKPMANTRPDPVNPSSPAFPDELKHRSQS